MNRVRLALRSPLFGTIAASVLLVLVISVWLLTDSRTSRSDALRTGGLAGGALVALYALWLNDRRRRVEEDRQDIERRRHELESVRISDERFARAVELLGHDADQVRVGALHALAGLARTRAGYTQTVLDVVCSYLRRPFEHPSRTDAADAEADRELQVRLTAQRLVLDLLPEAGADAPTYDLDLTGAAVEYLDLSGRKLGAVVLRRATLRSSTNLSDCEFTGPVWFTAAHAGDERRPGRFRCQGSTFHERAWFSGTVFHGLADFTGTTFTGEAHFKDAVFNEDAVFEAARFGEGLDLGHARFDRLLDLSWQQEPRSVSLYNTLVNPGLEHKLPESWISEDRPDGSTRLRVVSV